MNKQIEEIAKILNETCNVYDEQGNRIRNKCRECEYWSDDNHCCCSYNNKEAEALYNADYRKSTDVAREIFEEIENALVNKVSDGIKEQNPDWWLMLNIIGKLKKKYESEGAE